MPTNDDRHPQVHCEGSNTTPETIPGEGVGECPTCHELRPVADGTVDVHNRDADPDETPDGSS